MTPPERPTRRAPAPLSLVPRLRTVYPPGERYAAQREAQANDRPYRILLPEEMTDATHSARVYAAALAVNATHSR